jgi:hypothetical protein
MMNNLKNTIDMKQLKNFILAGIAVLSFSSCNSFLDTVPKDALSPSTTWKTEEDAQKFVVGCYDGWEDGAAILYWDCGSDFGYNNFPWEGFTNIGNGTMSPGDSGWSFYNFSTVRKCNTFMENVDNVTFGSDATKKDLVAQVRAIRAYSYFRMNFLYGGVPIIKNYQTAEEAQVPRNTEEEVKKFVYDELDALIPDLNTAPSARGRIAKGAALAIKMRSALYWGDYQRAKDAAQAIMDLKQYNLAEGADGYANLFNVAGQGSDEIILAVQYVTTTKSLGTIGQMYNNGDGGWSSVVPTQNLIDTYEMSNGLTTAETGSGYDATHPFYGRDPRMALTVIVPGSDFNGNIVNTLDQKLNDKTNPNYPLAADNSSKTGLTWKKYLDPMSQYADIWDTNACPIVFRYAEVLLTWAEVTNELTGPSAEVYDKLDAIRQRVGMPKVNRTKYATKDKLRELIRRERSVELAGEGVRRADLLRWKDSSGKMVAETALNGTLQRVVGTINYSETEPLKRAVINPNAEASAKKIEDRVFHTYNRYLPIPQDKISANPKLVQNDGYSK